MILSLKPFLERNCKHSFLIHSFSSICFPLADRSSPLRFHCFVPLSLFNHKGTRWVSWLICSFTFSYPSFWSWISSLCSWPLYSVYLFIYSFPDWRKMRSPLPLQSGKWKKTELPAKEREYVLFFKAAELIRPLYGSPNSMASPSRFENSIAYAVTLFHFFKGK